MDPQKNRFRLHSEFNFAAKEGVADPISYDQIKAEIVPNGPFAIIEFTGALPRTKFFTNWSVMTDDAATLTELGSETFDPQEKLLVSGSVPALSTNAVATGTNTVQVLSYQPREWKIEVENSAPGILLLNDKFDPDWSVTVSGQPATMLRSNYIMRGVHLPPGKHTVVFTYRVPSRGLFVSLASIIAGVGISLFLGFSSRRTGHNDPVKLGAAKTTAA